MSREALGQEEEENYDHEEAAEGEGADEEEEGEEEEVEAEEGVEGEEDEWGNKLLSNVEHCTGSIQVNVDRKICALIYLFIFDATI